MRIFSLAAVLLLSACASVSTPSLSGVDTVATLNAAGPISGSYRVAAVNADEVSLPEPITVGITDKAITVQSGCIGMAWDYSVAGNVLSTTSVPTRSCRRALLPQEQAVQAVLNAGGTLGRAPSAALVVSGSAGNITLHSQ